MKEAKGYMTAMSDDFDNKRFFGAGENVANLFMLALPLPAFEAEEFLQ